jgi:hypothetical protein
LPFHHFRNFEQTGPEQSAGHSKCRSSPNPWQYRSNGAMRPSTFSTITGDRMLDQEKQALLSSLRNGRNALGLALADVDDDLASRKPPSGGWSILDCMEHMAHSEQYLLTRLHAAKLSLQPFEKSRRAAKIAALAADRTRPIEAPPAAHAHGLYPTLREALAVFDATRAEVERYVQQSNGDLNCWITDHPLIPGPVTCYETLIMIAAHPARHAKQILEIRSALVEADRHL